MATLGLKEMGKFLWEVREKEGKGKGKARREKSQNFLLLAVELQVKEKFQIFRDSFTVSISGQTMQWGQRLC